MFRKTLFWLHLSAGIASAIIIFMLCLTGLILAFEPQIKEWAEQRSYPEMNEQSSPSGRRLSLDELAELHLLANPDASGSTLILENDPEKPVVIRAGRRGGATLNPWTGEQLEPQTEGLNEFFSTITGFHRWFDIQGENRDMARQIIGVANLTFLFLLFTGIYLWFPKVGKWVMFKSRLFFRGSYPNAKTRDFHWHHIFGFWAAIPLLVMIYTGSMFYYDWTGDLVYSAFGTERATRGGGGGNQGQQQQNQQRTQGGNEGVAVAAPVYLDLQQLADQVAETTERNWNRLNVTLPDAQDDTIDIEVDWGNSTQNHKRETLTLDRSSGEVLSVSGYADMSTATKIRGFTRFGHTGQLFGLTGQILAALGCLAGLFMVWTGLALSWRRLIQPLFRK